MFPLLLRMFDAVSVQRELYDRVYVSLSLNASIQRRLMNKIMR